MANEKGDSEVNNSEVFNFENELSNLVSQKVIPLKIADKLKEKLIQKKVKLNKEQFYMLVNKIQEIMENYKKPTASKTMQLNTANTDMNGLIEAIEGLKERIANIEAGKTSDYATYTTEDIQVPGKWELGTLTHIPNDPESIVILMKWLQYLIDKCGHMYLADILDYYVDIGWISDDAKISLVDYSKGIDEQNKKTDNLNKEASNLPSKDHIQSLIFIQKLKGNKIDRHFIERIDGEISRLTKKLDNYRLR